MLECKTCGEVMIGYAGDDICSDCAFGLRKSGEKACEAVSDAHFERTGERVDGSELLRRILFRYS